MARLSPDDPASGTPVADGRLGPAPSPLTALTMSDADPLAAVWSGDHLDETRIRFADVDGLRTRYYDAGSGDAVVLIHGGQFGSLYSLDCWSLNLLPLGERLRVIAYDKPGQGYTDKPALPEDYVVERVVRHGLLLLDRLDLGAVHLVGHSRGGLLAARIAIERPDRIRTLTLVDSGSLAPHDPALPVGAFYAPFEDRRLWDRPGRATALAEPAAQAFRPEWITEDFLDRMARIAMLPATASVRRTFAEVEMARWRPSLARCREDTLRHIDAWGLPVPTLILWGYNDRSAPRHLGVRLFERVAGRTPDVGLTVLSSAGHYLFRDRPDAFSEIVTSFCLGRGRAVAARGDG